MVRIATGRDAADTAFMTSNRGQVTVTSMSVVAYTDEPLAAEDLFDLTQLR